MARILVGNELGMGLGHVSKLMPVARELAARGHEVVLALHDPVTAWPKVEGSGFEVLPAPQFAEPPVPGDPPFLARSFADILRVGGYGSAKRLEPLARAWRALVDRVRPDLVIAEFSPTLCLACHGVVPTVAMGTGFTAPVLRNGSFPPLRPGVKGPDPSPAVAAVIADVLPRIGCPVPAEPLAAVLGDVQMALCFASLDPYARFRGTPSVGILEAMPAASPLPATPRCLVYLPASHRGVDKVLASIARARLPGIAYIPGARGPVLRALQASGLTVSESALDMVATLPQVSVVVHQGGAGLSQQCMAAGRPQVVLPSALEQVLNGNAIKRMGIGASVVQDADIPRTGTIANALQRSPEVHAAVARVAQRVHRNYPVPGLERVLEACLARLPS